MQHGTLVLSSETLIDDEVMNPAGEQLGKIEEIMLDVDNGRISYAVLSFGGMFGLGNKLFAVPWSALRLDPREKAFYLDVPREVLEHAPGFDKDNWPDFANPSWGQQVHNYYNVEPYWMN
jgi:sporulation protein YlmC with PRC-barrel domain